MISTSADEKSNLNNLIGRWYPESEVRRLSDPTLTPEQWCERTPTRVLVELDQVEVQCDSGAPHVAAIAKVKTSTRAGEITLVLRARKESALRQLRFEDVRGTRAGISGTPCFGTVEPYQRWPEFEILTRQILNNRRCSQLSPAVRRE